MSYHHSGEMINYWQNWLYYLRPVPQYKRAEPEREKTPPAILNLDNFAPLDWVPMPVREFLDWDEEATQQ